MRALADHYEGLGRPEAIRNLAAALEAAQIALPEIERHEPAPRPYPGLAKPGTGWLKSGRYWIAYTILAPRVIRAVFFETADIAKRFGDSR